MTREILNLWAQVSMKPIKGTLPQWGDLGGGFWEVAIVRRRVVYHNDAEHGFVRNRFDQTVKLAINGAITTTEIGACARAESRPAANILKGDSVRRSRKKVIQFICGPPYSVWERRVGRE